MAFSLYAIVVFNTWTRYKGVKIELLQELEKLENFLFVGAEAGATAEGKT